jgi:hypothetical protein
MSEQNPEFPYRVSFDLEAIDPSLCTPDGKKTWCTLLLHERELSSDGKPVSGVTVQNTTKEQRAAGKRGKPLGNWHTANRPKPQKPNP